MGGSGGAGVIDMAPAPWQKPAEFDQLAALYAQRKPQRVLEIGTYEGGTLYHWLQSGPELVVTVDDFRMGADNRSLYQEWVPAGTRLKVVEGDSHDPGTIAHVGRYAPFDWVFIDADHKYESVRDDWKNYGAMVDPGGVVAFHDIARHDAPGIEVHRLWEQIKTSGVETAEYVERGGGKWGGIGVVFV